MNRLELRTAERNDASAATAAAEGRIQVLATTRAPFLCSMHFALNCQAARTTATYKLL